MLLKMKPSQHLSKDKMKRKEFSLKFLCKKIFLSEILNSLLSLDKMKLHYTDKFKE
jgi:hypothetical protein